MFAKRDTDALWGTTEDRRKERKGMGAWAAPREDELGKVRYKPEGLGLYIDDPHATLKPEQQTTKHTLNTSIGKIAIKILCECEDEEKGTHPKPQKVKPKPRTENTLSIFTHQ